ncbi:hypothetical protein CLV92_11692 [Kineococcus xinjiangensis]|uniref:Uncharacterized protein n=1 Tax=Kineococcus xinjiangensis TaxID=512762 RepID=A0A2S6IDI7_9ACTN|nr:hypothetical protein [Kineococcus xinjiangensis]PPK92230.1 hypothetical protein CLV92_11692 [Kineococcus xinjiangensis]
MSYDFAVWEGPQPENDEAVLAHFERWAEVDEARDDSGELSAPPTARIKDFIEAVLAQHPDDEQGIWSAGLSVEDAHGPFVYLSMTFSGADRALGDIVELALARDLVCFDPQEEAVVTAADLE